MAVSSNVLVCGVGGLLFDVVWFVAVCELLLCVVFCLSNVCDLFVNESNGAVWSACMYYCLCLCIVDG